MRLAAEDAGMTLVFLAAEVVTLFAYSFLWQHVLRRMPLSFAYSNRAYARCGRRWPGCL